MFCLTGFREFHQPRPGQPAGVYDRYASQPGNDNGATHSFYTEQFTEQEIALIAICVADPSVDDEIWMQRVLNRRLMTQTNAKDSHGDGPPVDVLIKLAEALTIGAGRVARPLGDKRVHSGEAAAAFASAFNYARDELNRTLGTNL